MASKPDVPDAVVSSSASAVYGYDTDDDVAPPSKRSRGDVVEQIISYDTDVLASAGRHDEAMLGKLEEFSRRLQTSLRAVKKDRAEKERSVQAELAKKKREEKTKKFKELVDEKKCFKCKEVTTKGLQGCAYYNDYEKHKYKQKSPGGVLLCEECREEVMIEDYECCCCGGFTHAALGEDLCCNDQCSEKGFTCKECDEFYCDECAGDDVRAYEGDNWWCDGCA